MCGISGIVGIHPKEKARLIIESMNQAIAHRGPDDSGFYIEEGIALGQRRLSIIDLSSAGHQPMISTDGNLVLVFNGEIYNYLELKEELKEYPFQTKTDTEVILAAFQKWGPACVHRLNGMFAFAIWNKFKAELHIFRDRLGIKPLYFYQNDTFTLFASEIRALLQSGVVPRRLNRRALADYIRYQTVHAPQTIVDGIQMLIPGHYLCFSEGQITLVKYWSPEKDYSQVSVGKKYDEVKKDIFQLLQNAVERRLVADVPFGAFLSGGIDSSIIVGLMSQVAKHPVKTFAVTFEENEFSEAKYAALVATKFKTDHTEIRLSPNDFLEIIPAALKAMDHPSGDGPNTYIVSKVTKEAGITMALSGLGGDELFAGYGIFRRLYMLNNVQWFSKVPVKIRRAMGEKVLSLNSSVATDKISQLMGLTSWSLEHTYPLSRQLHAESSITDLLNVGLLEANQVEHIIKNSSSHQGIGQKLPFLSQISLAEISTYMQNTLLRDTDQMSMAHALEVRVPFLDYHLVEYVLGVRDVYKYPSSPKKLLVDAVEDLLPKEIINRPKMGFTLPWKNWMRNELFLFCEEKVKQLAQRSYFNQTAVLNIWKSFLRQDPRVGWSHVWYLVVLENWIQENGVE